MDLGLDYDDSDMLELEAWPQADPLRLKGTI